MGQSTHSPSTGQVIHLPPCFGQIHSTMTLVEFESTRADPRGPLIIGWISVSFGCRLHVLGNNLHPLQIAGMDNLYPASHSLQRACSGNDFPWRTPLAAAYLSHDDAGPTRTGSAPDWQVHRHQRFSIPVGYSPVATAASDVEPHRTTSTIRLHLE